MAKPRPCGCKGVRTCLVCELQYGAEKRTFCDRQDCKSYMYCPDCNKAWPGWDFTEFLNHPNHSGSPIDYPGVYIKPDFITKEEATLLMQGIDDTPWDLSQSGRRKQNFGPKCNFKKKKIALGNFNGFPEFSKFVQEKIQAVPLLKKFQTIEQCTLEYNPERGASIDPHIDDCWIWGERIVTVNVIGDSVLTMTPISEKDRARYNLSLVPEELCQFPSTQEDLIVRIPMPARSLIVLYGQARYQWEHQVLREDVTKLRVCLAYREFTPPYLEGGEHFDKIAKPVFEVAQRFF